MSGGWETKYRNVVWGKMGKHPFWPIYIFDPAVLYKEEPFYDQAHKKVGKEYTVSFYGDKTMGFVKTAMIRPFNKETLKEMEKQNEKLDNATKKLWKAAIKQAQSDSDLPLTQRLQWYFDKYNLNPETGEEIIDSTNNDNNNADVMDEGGYFEESERETASITGEKRKRDEVDYNENEEDDDDDDDISSDDNSSSDDEVVSDDRSDTEVGNKRRKTQKAAVGGRGRPTLKKSTTTATTATSSSAAKEKKTTSTKKTSTAVARKKTLKYKQVAPAAPTVAVAAAASAMFENESKEDRLGRLTAILQLTSSDSTLDEKRALKTIDKIKEIKLSAKEMTASDIATIVNNIKSACKNDAIREGCNQLCAKWKTEGVIAPASSSSSSKAEPARFAVDRVSKKSPAITATTIVGKGNKPSNINNQKQEEVMITLDLVRKRSVRLLDIVIRNEAIALVVENTIANRFGYQQSASAYFEAVTRTFVALKVCASSLSLNYCNELL